MNKWQKGMRKILIATTALVLMGAGSQWQMQQVFAAQENTPLWTESAENTGEQTFEVTPQIEMIELPEMETSSWSWSMFTLGADEKVPLKSTTHANWIDRLDLTGADYALPFYNWLVENSDNDNSEDALIEPILSTGTVEQIGEYTCYVLREITGTETFTCEKGASKEVIDAAAETAARAALEGKFEETVKYATAVYSAFDRDCPQVFWLSGESQVVHSTGYSYYFQGTSGTVEYKQTIGFVLQSSKFDIRESTYVSKGTAALKSKIAGVDSKVNTIVNEAASKTTYYDKLKYFNNWLTTNNCYNSYLAAAGNDTHECISALTGLTGTEGPVCEGYARAFKVLCDEVGIPCVLVDGDANSGDGASEAHMWNYVQIGEKWYAVDVTWNDPKVNGVNTAVSTHENEDYFLVGSESVIDGTAFIESHPVSNIVTENGVAFVNGPLLQETAYVPVTCHTDDNGDNKCDACGKLMVDTVTGLEGHSLSLSKNLDVNFYMELDDSVLNDSTAYMQFTLPGKDPVQVKVDSVGAPVEQNGKTCYVFTYEVAAKEMADTITAQMFCSDGNGGTRAGTAYEYSVKQYAEALLGGNTATDAEKKLAKAMLNYGAYAQLYFGYNTNNLANAGNADNELAVMKSELQSFKPVVDGENETFTYAGSTLLLEADVKVRHYFKLKEGQEYTGSGLTLYAAQPGDNLTGTYYYWESEGITAASLGTMKEYTGVSGISINYCPLSYVTTAVVNTDTTLTEDTKLQNLLKALYLYYQATK